jgi:hypothetical protein
MRFPDEPFTYPTRLSRMQSNSPLNDVKEIFAFVLNDEFGIVTGKSF